MNEFDKILENQEQVLWEGSPKFWPFFLSSLAGSFFGIFFLAISLIFVTEGIESGNYWMLLLPHFWIGLLMTFGVPIYRLLVYKHTKYAVTNKRALLQRGVIGRDFQMVDFDKVTNADVDVNFLDVLFGRGSGSIKISTAGTFYQTKNGVTSKAYTFSHIENPYEVFKFFKEVSHAVKSDIEYPNAYRPQENPGYDSGYTPKTKV